MAIERLRKWYDEHEAHSYLTLEELAELFSYGYSEKNSGSCCGSGETEVVSYVGCYVILVGLLYPNWICGLIPYEWKSTFRAKTTFSSISLVFATINFTSG